MLMAKNYVQVVAILSNRTGDSGEENVGENIVIAKDSTSGGHVLKQHVEENFPSIREIEYRINISVMNVLLSGQSKLKWSVKDDVNLINIYS